MHDSRTLQEALLQNFLRFSSEQEKTNNGCQHQKILEELQRSQNAFTHSPLEEYSTRIRQFVLYGSYSSTLSFDETSASTTGM